MNHVYFLIAEYKHLPTLLKLTKKNKNRGHEPRVFNVQTTAPFPISISVTYLFKNIFVKLLTEASVFTVVLIKCFKFDCLLELQVA